MPLNPTNKQPTNQQTNIFRQKKSAVATVEKERN